MGRLKIVDIPKISKTSHADYEKFINMIQEQSVISPSGKIVCHLKGNKNKIVRKYISEWMNVQLAGGCIVANILIDDKPFIMSLHYADWTSARFDVKNVPEKAKPNTSITLPLCMLGLNTGIDYKKIEELLLSNLSISDNNDISCNFSESQMLRSFIYKWNYIKHNFGGFGYVMHMTRENADNIGAKYTVGNKTYTIVPHAGDSKHMYFKQYEVIVKREVISFEPPVFMKVYHNMDELIKIKKLIEENIVYHEDIDVLMCDLVNPVINEFIIHWIAGILTSYDKMSNYYGLIINQLKQDRSSNYALITMGGHVLKVLPSVIEDRYVNFIIMGREAILG